MATTESGDETEPNEADLPSNRTYESEVDAELDEALTEAIKKARAADDEYLATVLENELKSHYYGSQLNR